MIEVRSARVAGVRMRWEESGTGFPAVFLHGLPTSPALWRRVLGQLSGVRVLAWELVGYGRSIPEGIGRGIGVAAQADWVVEWLRSIGIDRAILVGHDVGGAVAQLVAVHHPGLVAGLVLVDAAAYDAWPSPVHRWFRRPGLAGALRHFPDALFEPVLARLLRRGHDDPVVAEESVRVHWEPYALADGAAAFARQVRSLDPGDTLSVAEALRLLREIPCRVLWGSLDPYQPIRAGERLARDLGTTLGRIEGARHFTPEDHPLRIAGSVSRLAREVRTRRRWFGPLGLLRERSSRIERRRADMLRGRVLVASLGEILPDEADPRVREIYDDIRRTLRVPIVNQIFRTLAHEPDFLEREWHRLRPLLLSPEFEAAADRLRALAILEPAPTPWPRDFPEGMDVRRVLDFTRTMHYVLPKILLLASALDQDLGEHGLAPPERPASPSGAPLPTGIADGTASLQGIDPDQVGGSLRGLFQDIRRRHGHPGIAAYYRSLGRYPEILRLLWSRLRPVVGSTPYHLRRRDLLVEAESALARLGAPEAPRPELSPDDRVRLRSIASVFRYRLVPDLLLDVSLVRAIFEGPDEAKTNPFQLAGGSLRP